MHISDQTKTFLTSLACFAKQKQQLKIKSKLLKSLLHIYFSVKYSSRHIILDKIMSMAETKQELKQFTAIGVFYTPSVQS